MVEVPYPKPDSYSKMTVNKAYAIVNESLFTNEFPHDEIAEIIRKCSDVSFFGDQRKQIRDVLTKSGLISEREFDRILHGFSDEGIDKIKWAAGEIVRRMGNIDSIYKKYHGSLWTKAQTMYPHFCEDIWSKRDAVDLEFARYKENKSEWPDIEKAIESYNDAWLKLVKIFRG